MTQDEQKIIEFLVANDVGDLADLPDWLLGLRPTQFRQGSALTAVLPNYRIEVLRFP